jgi:hypothetical protein
VACGANSIPPTHGDLRPVFGLELIETELEVQVIHKVQNDLLGVRLELLEHIRRLHYVTEVVGEFLHFIIDLLLDEIEELLLVIFMKPNLTLRVSDQVRHAVNALAHVVLDRRQNAKTVLTTDYFEGRRREVRDPRGAPRD